MTSHAGRFTIHEQIEELYNDPLYGFISASKLKHKLKAQNILASTKQIQEVINNQETYQLNKRQNKPKKFNTIVANGNRDCYQMDIMIYDRFKYHNYKYILVVIDVFSRFVHAKALTSREMDTIMSTIKTIFKVMGKPNNINCDNEFNKKEFNKYCQDNHIETYFSQPDR